VGSSMEKRREGTTWEREARGDTRQPRRSTGAHFDRNQIGRQELCYLARADRARVALFDARRSPASARGR
jgi:hypothetical protein